MRHRARQLPGRVAGQLGIAVERNHVPRTCQTFKGPDDQVESSGFSTQCRIEIFKLPPLALPSHPDLVLYIPATSAVKQEKIAYLRRLIIVGRPTAELCSIPGGTP